MKKTIFTIVFLFSFNLFAQVTVDVVLNPMGNFNAKTESISGNAVMNGTDVSAQNIKVDLRTLKTGLELRDKHTQKYLNTAQHPEAILSIGKGKNGKGVGRIKINGQEKEIKGTYKVTGKNLQADFNINISEFNIKDVNYMGVGVEDKVKIHVIIPIGAAAATAPATTAPAQATTVPVKAVSAPAPKK
jgi:polyisoprenoid-binding protein YceI